MQRILVLILLLTQFVNSQLFAQTELTLKKGYTPKTIHHFKVGDPFRYAQKGSDDIYEGKIIVLGDSSILVNDQSVLYNNITAVYLPRDSYFRKVILNGLAQSAIQLPIYLIVYGNINAIVYNLWSTDFLIRNLLVNGSIMASGLAMQALLKNFNYKKYSMKNYRIVYLNFSLK
jgi:hypothetical protein